MDNAFAYALPLLLAFLVAGAPPPADRLPDERPPNIIFIMADDLGYGHLGVYGQQHISTPHIDQMAAEGMRFTQTYAGATVCAPSRSVLMTGLHMGHAPVRGNSGGIPLRDEDVTLGEVMQSGGYTTGVFGKWGLGEAGTAGVPTRQGFDVFAGYLHQIHAHFYYPSYLWKNEDRWPLPGNEAGGRLPGDANGQRNQYAPDEILNHALHFIRDNADRPFLAYLPMVIPHVEIIVPDASEAPYRGRFEETPFDDPRPGYVDPRTPRATYAGMIAHLDRNVGRVLQLLKDLGIDDETIVFFTSDNGAQRGYGTNAEFFNATGGLRGRKRDHYEGGLRVPMIVRWPGKVAAGRVNDDLVWYFPDVLPTLAELGGITPPAGLDGLSVVPTLLGEAAAGRPQARHDHLYWAFGDRDRNGGAGFAQAVRQGDWKAVRPGLQQPVELYNLRTDPAEANDVAAGHPERAEALAALMEAAYTPPRPQVEPMKVQGLWYR